jgi:hypothetical protein
MPAQPESKPPDPTLQGLLAAAEEVSRATQSLCAGLTEDQLTYRPELDRWSIAHCFDHLRTVNELYFWRLRPAIERARRRGRTGGQPLRLSWLGRKVYGYVLPESPRRIRTQKIFRPADKPPAQSWRHFLAGQATLLSLLREAEELPVNRIRVSSPVSPLLRFTLGDALAMMVVHEQRHLLQAQRVREDPYFPTW